MRRRFLVVVAGVLLLASYVVAFAAALPRPDLAPWGGIVSHGKLAGIAQNVVLCASPGALERIALSMRVWSAPVPDIQTEAPSHRQRYALQGRPPLLHRRAADGTDSSRPHFFGPQNDGDRLAASQLPGDPERRENDLPITATTSVSPPIALRPNIVFILADDLGYGDLGSFGQQKIRTPNLDQLAREGMRLTQHYSGNAVCAPSRCVLMTGLHPGHAPVRDNREAKPEGQFPLAAGTVTLPKLLHTLAYATGAFGKWGLGGPGSSGDPMHQGVGRFFGYNCQRIAHNYYPTYLWDNDRRIDLQNPSFAAHAKLGERDDPQDPAAYARFSGKDYAPDLIAEQARRFVRDNKDRSFFLYWPTTVPHLALQVPEDSVVEYKAAFPEEPYPGGKGYLPHRTPRAAYAAMITRMDREIGSVMALVKELGLDERTIFVFTSDNGPLYDKLGGTDADFFASAGALRGRKGSLFEGGIRVPCLVRWKGRIAPGSTSERVTGFEDWLPTLLDLAGAPEVIPGGIDGFSFAPTLLGQTQEPRPFLYREFPGYGGQQAVRLGDWKGLRQGLKKAEGGDQASLKIALYRLADDPAEKNDIAESHPEVVAEIAGIMEREHTPSVDFPIPVLDRSR